MVNVNYSMENLPEENRFKALFQLFMKHFTGCGLFHKKPKKYMIAKNKEKPEDLINILRGLGKNRLANTLEHIENKDGGYGSIVVPKDGFTNREDVNDRIMSWLKTKGVNIVNVQSEIAALESSLRS